jgi:hypothetical protein
MSDTQATFPTHPPSNPNKTVEKDGYRASFYPGFVRRLAVQRDGIDTELYDQDEIFYLPPGVEKPWPCSTLEFSAPDGRRFVLQIDDPGQQIGRIEVHLKTPEEARARPELVRRLAGETDALLGGEPPCVEGEGRVVVILEDAPVLCPPICPI